MGGKFPRSTTVATNGATTIDLERPVAARQRRRALRRRTSVLMASSITKKLGFWDKGVPRRPHQARGDSPPNYVYLVMGFVIALSIYGGAYYDVRRATRTSTFAGTGRDAAGQCAAHLDRELAHSFFL